MIMTLTLTDELRHPTCREVRITNPRPPLRQAHPDVLGVLAVSRVSHVLCLMYAWSACVVPSRAYSAEWCVRVLCPVVVMLAVAEVTALLELCEQCAAVVSNDAGV